MRGNLVAVKFTSEEKLLLELAVNLYGFPSVSELVRVAIERQYGWDTLREAREAAQEAAGITEAPRLVRVEGKVLG